MTTQALIARMEGTLDPRRVSLEKLKAIQKQAMFRDSEHGQAAGRELERRRRSDRHPGKPGNPA